MAKIGRNQPCPCGSGKKHKKCCGRPGQRLRDLPIEWSQSSATENAEHAAPSAQLDDRRAELAAARALVEATDPTSPQHETFLDYLDALAESLQTLYDEGDADSDEAEIFHQALRAFVPLVDCDWLRLRPPGLVELDEDDRALLREIRHYRDVFTSREPPSPEATVLVNLMVMAMEAIEIYIIIRYDDGRKACLDLMMAVGHLCGFEPGQMPAPVSPARHS